MVSLSNPLQISVGGAVTLSYQNGKPIILDPNKNATELLNLFFPDDNSTPKCFRHREVRNSVSHTLNDPLDFTNIKNITPTEVHIAFTAMRPFSSAPDCLPAAFIQWSLDLLATPLAQIFSACLFHLYFPLDWKKGTLLTLPKSSDKLNLSSHKSQRPITLLPVLGKGFEKILLDRFLNIKTQWHNKAQRGFIKGSSTRTEAALLQVLNSIQSKLKRSHNMIAGLSLDIAAAFDRAWHPAILKNLIDKDMPLPYVKLIQNYLLDRQISLSYGGGTASKTLTRSTPQGAVLSPFLWDIFLDTLLDTLSKFQAFPNFIEIYAWADDVLLLIPFDRNDTASLTTTIEKILHEAD